MKEKIVLPIYQASLALLAHKKSYNNLDLYRMTIETAEFQLLQALWKHFGFHESINKENLLNCQMALGLNDSDEFKNLLVKHELISASKFDRILES